jgi:glycosyltransferase involved in cell wall biosynthesis
MPDVNLVQDRTVVCFAGPRDHYEGAAALAQAGLLERLVTDAYFAGQAWHDHAPGQVREYVRARRNQLIEADAVSLSACAFFWEIFGRLPGVNQQACRNRKDAAIGRHAAFVAEKTEAHLLAYSYYAGAAFASGRRLRSRLLFQVHPAVAPLRRLYQEEINREPAARDSLSAEMEMQPMDAHAEAEQTAPIQAQGILCASNFTRRTLVEAGATAPVHVMPYGVDATTYRCRNLAPTGKFPVAFIGAFTARKGALYLLRALRPLAAHVRLVIYTRAKIDPALAAELGGLDVEIRSGLSNEALAADITRCHLLALPSIAEGFGLAISEAMACGVPVVCTENTGGADFIRPGEGYVLPIRSVDKLTQVFTEAMAGQEALYEMGQAARRRVEQMTWADYRRRFADAYLSLIESL